MPICLFLFVEPYVSIESPNSCNTSQSIKLICTIEAYDTNVWDNKWHHYRSGVYIRPLNGSVSTGVSSLDIRYCDYQDTGTYTCSWTCKGVNLSASTDLIVYGRVKILNSKDFKIIWLIKLFCEYYFRNASCALRLISTF